MEKLFSTTDNSFATTNLSSPEVKESKDDKKGPLVLGAAGTYNDMTSAASCPLCPAGYYSGVGATSCSIRPTR